MNNLQKRTDTANAILENRFMRRVLQDTGKDIDQAQTKYMTSRGFDQDKWYSGRSFNTTDNSLDMEVLKVHRFVDMKSRVTKAGKKNKKSHPVYNRIVWGHYNNIIKEMHFGFTEAVKQELRQLGN